MTKNTIAHRNVGFSVFYRKFRKIFPKVLRPWFEQNVLFPVTKEKFNFYMSLGENCLSARTLKEMNLRKFSGPFDWIAKNGFSDRVEQIKSNFKNALNYEDLQYDTDTHPDHNTCLVKNLKTGFCYPHDFIDDSKEEFLKQAQKYRRRQDRIYLLAKEKDGLFIYGDIASELLYSEYDEKKLLEFFEGMQRLQQKLEMRTISMILVVKGNQGQKVDFLDHYSKDGMNLFVQPVPYFKNEPADSLFDLHSIYIKRALTLATQISP